MKNPAAIFGGLAVHQAATNDSIVVEPISVPSGFEGKGFRGAIATSSQVTT
jgi:hypothetical protein